MKKKTILLRQKFRRTAVEQVIKTTRKYSAPSVAHRSPPHEIPFLDLCIEVYVCVYRNKMAEFNKSTS